MALAEEIDNWTEWANESNIFSIVCYVMFKCPHLFVPLVHINWGILERFLEKPVMKLVLNPSIFETTIQVSMGSVIN